MKVIRFSVSEAQYTFLKTVVGFDNLEDFFCPHINNIMKERLEHIYENTVSK